jgi:hypothetical protein
VRIIISPGGTDGGALKKAYTQAFAESRELFIASAYLTDWSHSGTLSKRCKRLVFVVGTDFGLTRKAALTQVLKWLPKHGAPFFGAVRSGAGQGFHPKMMVWATHFGKHSCIVGSSNLSKAAFTSNHEANVLCSISPAEYRRLTGWIQGIADAADEVSEDWIRYQYREAKRLPFKGKKQLGLAPTVVLKLPRGSRYAPRVRERREQQRHFRSIAKPLLSAARRCAAGRMSNLAFWRYFWRTWSEHESRFQGQGLQIAGKHSNWRAVCRSLVRVVDSARSADEGELDQIVSGEIDALANAGNAARGAWLSEMLCHYLPGHYPVINGPVEQWVALNKWRPRRGSTQGQRYIQLALRLRHALRERPAGARNLAELDLAIWQWVQDRK